MSALSLYLTGGPGTFVPGPVFSSTLPCYQGFAIRAPKSWYLRLTHHHMGWLVIERIGRDGAGGEPGAAGTAGTGDWGQRLPKNAAQVSLGAQQVSPGTGTGTSPTPTCRPEGPWAS